MASGNYSDQEHVGRLASGKGYEGPTGDTSPWRCRPVRSWRALCMFGQLVVPLKAFPWVQSLSLVEEHVLFFSAPFCRTELLPPNLFEAASPSPDDGTTSLLRKSRESLLRAKQMWRGCSLAVLAEAAKWGTLM